MRTLVPRTPFVVAAALTLAACSSGPAPHSDPLRGLVEPGKSQAVQAHEWKAPDRAIKEDEVQGKASWYGDRHHGNLTANGETFDMYAFTAAHKTLPFNTIVRVVHVDSGRSVVVRINDRGPFARGRVIDLSKAAAKEIGILKAGVAEVNVDIVSWGDGARYHHGKKTVPKKKKKKKRRGK